MTMMAESMTIGMQTCAGAVAESLYLDQQTRGRES